MEKRNQSFGRLLKAAMASVGHIEGKTQQGIEQEFGVLLGVAGVTLQRYKAGFIPPDLKRVELLAEVGVRRGFLGRPWLDRFLAAANVSVHHGRTLTALLFPEAAALAARNLKPSNLPAPTYAHFVMRRAAYEATLDGLRSALPATLIFSIGGMGKTSLARAVCADCLARAPRAPIFATVVWISDKDHPGNTNLSSALNTIARALDYPGLASIPFAERLREVEGLLRSQPVLLVLDNADSITDDALMEWVVCLPEPSKALITSRSLLPSTANVYLVELEPMNEKEAEALIASRAPGSRLRRSMASLDQLIPIAQAAGGNPKAIELALGLVQQRPRDAVLADLTGARLDLFDELFARAWALLDSYAQRVLLALPLFPGSASAEALAACAELSPDALTRTTDQLSGLALLDVERG